MAGTLLDVPVSRVSREESQKFFTPLRNTRLLNNGRFPTYCAGSLYAFEGERAKKLLDEAIKTPILTIEDVYISGLVREKAKMGLVHLENAVPRTVDICTVKDTLFSITSVRYDQITIQDRLTHGLNFYDRLMAGCLL